VRRRVRASALVVSARSADASLWMGARTRAVGSSSAQIPDLAKVGMQGNAIGTGGKVREDERTSDGADRLVHPM